MRFMIVNNKGRTRFVSGVSNAQGDIIEDRLRTIAKYGRIKRYERLNFERITPNDILKI